MFEKADLPDLTEQLRQLWGTLNHQNRESLIDLGIYDAEGNPTGTKVLRLRELCQWLAKSVSDYPDATSSLERQQSLNQAIRGDIIRFSLNIPGFDQVISNPKLPASALTALRDKGILDEHNLPRKIPSVELLELFGDLKHALTVGYNEDDYTDPDERKAERDAMERELLDTINKFESEKYS